MSCQKGETGPAGKDGTNNVHSQTFTTEVWTQSGNTYICYLNDADITQEILDKGVMNSYIEIGTGNWYSLPYNYYYVSSIPLSFLPLYSLGKVRIQAINYDNSPISDPGMLTFKVVCIEGN